MFIVILPIQRTQFKKVGDADPEIIGTLNDDFKIVELNNKVYFIDQVIGFKSI